MTVLLPDSEQNPCETIKDQRFIVLIQSFLLPTG